MSRRHGSISGDSDKDRKTKTAAATPTSTEGWIRAIDSVTVSPATDASTTVTVTTTTGPTTTADMLQSTRILLETATKLRDLKGLGILHDCTGTVQTLSIQSALLDRAQKLDEAITGQQSSSIGFVGATDSSSIQIPSTASTIRRDWMLARDLESGYTPLHCAVAKGDLAGLLLLLRHALSNDSPRISQRPMNVLAGETGTVSVSAFATTTSSKNDLVQAVISARDWEAMTAADLLAAQQRKELQAVRETLYRPIVIDARHSTEGRWRQSSFDLQDDDQDEQNELNALSRGLQFLKQGSGSSNNSHDTSTTLPKDAGHDTYGCEVFTFGRAHHCALGLVASKSSSNDTAAVTKVRPNRVQAFAQSQVGRAGGAVAIAGATHHTLVATAQGHVYAFGLGKGGRLGAGDEAHCPLPTRVRGPLSSRRVVVVAAADNHSLCVTACGVVYAWGSNRFGQLGTTVSSNLEDGVTGSARCLPRRVEDLKGVMCISVAAGEKHSVALSKQGEVYLWGDNTAGQLATSRRTGLHKVQRVEALWNPPTPKAAIAIAASEQATMILTAPTGSGLPVNSIFTWGHGNHSPSKVKFESCPQQRGRPVNPVAIACARYHSVAITAEGLVYSWGLHSESLGTQRTKKVPAMSTVVFASPQLVTGMLPENGGGKAVAVSASENHTAVLTDTGALFTWGSTYGKNILGHEGVRWQPDPKRVPGVYRAVGVAAAKEHTVLLVGATFPALPLAAVDISLENLAARKAAEHVDIFNALPVLITAERTQCSLLLEYCREFVRRNLDGVLNVGQRSHMDCYLSEQLSTCFVDSDKSRDSRHHPLLLDIVTAGNIGRPSFEIPVSLSSTVSWLHACSKLSQSPLVAAMIKRYTSDPSKPVQEGSVTRSRRSRSISTNSRSASDLTSSDCSEHCLSLTTDMDLSSKELTQEKHAHLVKEMRWVRKRLGQIAKLQDPKGELQLTSDQVEKLSRQPQLKADLLLFQPALEAIEKRLKDFSLAEAKVITESKETVKIKTKTASCVDKNKLLEPAVEESPKSPSLSLRCNVCEITCPDMKCYTLHINGRKHRNRVATATEIEQHKAAASMMAERQRQQMSGQAVIYPPKKATVYSRWSVEKIITQPRYKLPPPPHPLPEGVDSGVACRPSDTKNLREIMAEESKQVESIVKSSPFKSKKTTLRLPKGSAPPLQSPPWASPVARVAATAAPSHWAAQSDQPKGAYSLGDFIKPAHSTVKPGPIRWAAPPAKVSAAQTSPSALSLRDIQQQEHEFKTQKQDQTFGDNSKWFIERRERAGSFKEIQTETAKQLEERLFIEEQIRIEKEINNELAAQKVKEEVAGPSRSNKKPKKRKPKAQTESKRIAADKDKRDHPKPKPRHRNNSSGGNKRNPEVKQKKSVDC